MRYLLLLMAAPQLAFAGTSAAHSNDFKALEILETSQPPAAAPAPKPAPIPKPKPAPPEPSAEAQALDALMASTPDSVPATDPAPAQEPKPMAKTVAAPRKLANMRRPLRTVARAKVKPKPEMKIVHLTPPAKSRYVNYTKSAPAAEPAKPAVKFAMSAPSKSNQVPSKIDFKPSQGSPNQSSNDEIEPTEAPAPTVAAAAAPKPSADAEALDSLMESTPDTQRSALTQPVSSRYANDDEGRGEIDPNEIQRVAPKKIQNVWY